MITLKLLVHKEKKQVLYAESDQDFVDVLFSFLTMPLGQLFRLIALQRNIGSLKALHKSVEDLDTKLLQTNACRDMLLYPKTAKEDYQSKNLKVDISSFCWNPADYYICFSCLSYPETRNLVSPSSRTRCHCGKELNKDVNFRNSSEGEDGVFVKGDMKFMITDDLKVSPVSTLTSFALLKTLGINDASVLEVRNENVNIDGVLCLLKNLSVSKKPLTDTFLVNQEKINLINLEYKDMAHSDRDADDKSKKMNIKLLRSRSNSKVLYAEAGGEFPDLLFCFLTFPIGSVVKLLGGCPGMGCVDNLYKSVQDLSLKDCMKSEECKAMLLSPKIAPYFGSKNQLLKIEEQVPLQPKLINCPSCPGSYITLGNFGERPHGKKGMQLRTVNPKYSAVVDGLGGAFVTGSAMFTVTDELIVKPLSPVSGISFINKFGFQISDLEEVVVSVGEMEALSLLRASLISNTVLSDVFCSKKPEQSKKRSSEGMVPSDKRAKTETWCL